METKICARCKVPQELSNFNKDKNKKDGLGNWCKTCNKDNMRTYYLNNKVEMNKANYQTTKKTRIDYKQRILEILKDSKCTDCGNNDYRVLEFDHVKGKKIAHVSTLVKNTYSWERIEAEIAKCEIVCCNCHRIRTIERAGTYRSSSQNTLVQR